MIYGSRMPPQDDVPPPQDDSPSPQDDTPGDGPSTKDIFRMIKLGLMVILLIVKFANTHACNTQKTDSQPVPPDAIVVSNIVTADAVSQAFGEAVTGFASSQFYVQFSLPNDTVTYMAFLSNEKMGSYEAENRKSGDVVQKVDGVGQMAEFILGDQSQELIVLQQEHLIILTCTWGDDEKAVDRKAELLALGKLCCINLNKLTDK